MNSLLCLVFSLTALAVPGTGAYDYECNYPLLEKATLTATSFMKDREPKQARLYGFSAWTPHDNSYNQHLTVDLDDRYEIRSIATRGRASTREFVTEYIVEYSDDGQAWTTYETQDGVEEMFKGNDNAENIALNRFRVPIIAQYIRINPTRWRDRISMRVELYGCSYESDVMSFNGTSLVRMDLLYEPIETDRHSIRFRFKTNNADGVIMYSRGTQGDFIAVQLRDNKMLLNIDLGSGITTSLSVGSLLDNNLWHDVLISRNRKNITLSVDRVSVKGRIKGEFHRLDLNRALYIGAVPYKQEGIIVTQNFTGCIENFHLNQTNIIRSLKDAERTGEFLRYEHIHTTYSCPEPLVSPMTFLTKSSYITIREFENTKSMNVSLAFRTYEKDGLIMFHEFRNRGFIKLYLDNGLIKVALKDKSDKRESTFDNFEERFNDGKWHNVILVAGKDNIILNIDDRSMSTRLPLDILLGPNTLIGGVPRSVPGIIGFIGCMKLSTINTGQKAHKIGCCPNEIVREACQMLDRCNPNPCKHNGICEQTSISFECKCNEDYGGAVCHTPLHPLSCEAHRNIASIDQQAKIKIDVDGSGPLEPFPVTCKVLSDGRVQTILQHANELTTPVDGFDEPGSFEQDITYDADYDQIVALINRATTCRQNIRYDCRQSRLFNTPLGQSDIFQPNSWWVSRNNQKMDYWGGALPGSRKCECGIIGNCVDSSKWCNCDSRLESWLSDGGDIIEKEYLPVSQLHFGDTGTSLDDKQGAYTLGPLICEGDDLFNNIVTFRIADATINLPPFDMGHNGDIYFEFKTTTKNAVIIHSTGENTNSAPDYIKISIVNGDKIQFEYQAGDKTLKAVSSSSSSLANNQWHSVSVERNRKEAKLLVDGVPGGYVAEPPGPVRALHLTSEFVIGATTTYHDGYVGCIRSLLLNGKLQDLRQYARRGLYGISEGCIGKCDSSPCLNNGTCHERYDGYDCDCRWTAFKGPICADEIGVNMQEKSMIQYDFIGNYRSTIAENIRIGFTTTNPKGFLLGLSSNITGEYMTIQVSNNGFLRVVYDFGFERREVIYPDKNFALGQHHDVRIRRKNGGSTLVIEADNNEPVEFTFDINESTDAQFNNIQHLFIGRNHSMTVGFTGCISRVQFEDIYPLKLYYQQGGIENIKSEGSLIEEYCGREPITHPPDIIETRPPPVVNEEKVRAAYNETDTAVLGSVLAVIVLAIIIMAILIGRYMSRHKGEYLTQEDKGAEMALDPDSAVVHSTTGHQVQKKKEWFI